MQSGLFDLKAELTRKEEQLTLKKQNVPSEKSNKTFSKISALTGKQKKKNVAPVYHASEKEIDDESAALFEKARAKLEAKSKLYEKMHSGEMEDLENIYGETTFLVDFHKKYEDGRNRDENIDGKKKFETKGSYALFEADEENRERLREKWAREQQEILDGPVHYENIKFDEVRNLGTGYFAFSKDEQTRKEQLEELNKLRENTKNIQSKKEILNNKRKLLLEDRLAKVRQKKLGKIDIEINIDQSESSNKNAAALNNSENNSTDKSGLNELESNSTDINTFIQECRKQTQMTREWDKGKHETYVEQAFVKPSKISYEKIVNARRQERNDDFAPPNLFVNMDWEYFVLSIVTVFYGLFLRSSVSLNSYSGAGKPPMYGDYEAQRHWMEITYNLPTAEWYWQTESNDLMYWGLDYPPLTAYHSKLCGIIANFINPQWVALNVSRGFESYHHKVFMRYTVLFVDLLIYIPSILYFYSVTLKSAAKTKKFFMSALVLTYPGLILIDHGHFQYNCVSLGFACFAVVSLLKDQYELGASIFVLALNYKQMELYHALPFFFYLLGICLHQLSWRNKILKLSSIGLTVVLTFVLCWAPFLTSHHSILQVLHRLFPFNRGLYEDKVANFWCSLSVIYKMKNLFDQQQILKVCLASTLLACVPSSLNLLYFPTKKKFLYSMVNCSLAFFLFSFQVHEKSILIIALPVSLLLLDCPLVSVWFLVISTVSMYPLLERDGQSFSYFSLLMLFIVISLCTMDYSNYHIFVKLIVGLSFFGILVLHVLPFIIMAPKNLPDLYALLFSVYCCIHFLFMLVYFNYKQWKCNKSDVSADNLFTLKKIKNN